MLTYNYKIKERGIKMEFKHYKCESCGNIFEKDEASIYFEYGKFDACPRCKSLEIEEVNLCQECKIPLNNNTEEKCCDLCKKCLLKLVDYQIGYDYIVNNEDLTMFIFKYIFDVKEPPEVNELLMNEIKMMFERKKVEDFLYNKPLLLNKIKEYIENDLRAFSDYLKEKGVI